MMIPVYPSVNNPLLDQIVAAISAPEVASMLAPEGQWREVVSFSPIDNIEVRTPDWGQMTLADLPSFLTSGQVFGLGDRPTARWEAGDHPLGVLRLGDFQTSLRLQALTLKSILENRQIEADTLTLADFELFRAQTLDSLTAAVPKLLELPAAKVEPIRDLLISAEVEAVLLSTPVGEILAYDPNLGMLQFKNLDLSKYELESIPGILQVPLQNWAQWEDATIYGVPGLDEMPWSDFPQPPSLLGAVGVIQAGFCRGTACMDEDVPPLVTGNNQTAMLCGSSPNCEQVVAETGDGPVSLATGQQLVEAGTGTQEGALEPTGIFPYGSAFKVVIESISTEGIRTSAYFRTCRDTGAVNCSGYEIGPIPFFSYRTGEAVFLGSVSIVEPSAPIEPAVVQTVAEEAQDVPVAVAIILLVLMLGFAGFLANLFWDLARDYFIRPKVTQTQAQRKGRAIKR